MKQSKPSTKLNFPLFFSALSFIITQGINFLWDLSPSDYFLLGLGGLLIAYVLSVFLHKISVDYVYHALFILPSFCFMLWVSYQDFSNPKANLFTLIVPTISNFIFYPLLFHIIFQFLIKELRRVDPIGLGIAMISVSVVFSIYLAKLLQQSIIGMNTIFAPFPLDLNLATMVAYMSFCFCFIVLTPIITLFLPKKQSYE